MSPGMVRTGGIIAFVAIAVAIIGGFVIASITASSFKPGMTVKEAQAAMSGFSIGGVILGLIINLMIIFVFWTTKGLFNARGYHGGDIPILILIVVVALNWVLSLFGGAAMNQLGNINQLASVGGFVVILSLVLMLLLFISLIWFSISCLGYGKAATSGLWKAIGILYLIAFGCFVLAMIIVIIGALTASPQTTPGQVSGLAAFAGILILIGGLVALAGWICHGIGLITGAGKMPGAAAPAAA